MVQKRYSKLIENIFSLLTLRVLEYVLAFILVPYLIRTLGPMNFGAIAFMQGIMEYFRIFVDYGYSLTAPKEIAQAEGDIKCLFSKYFYGKLILLIGVTITFVCIYQLQYYIFGKSINILLFEVMYFGIIGNLLFPVWFFQGIQQMRYITILNMCGRLISMVGIFLLVKSPDDYILSAFLQSCTPLIAGVFSIFWLLRNYKGIFSFPKLSDVMTSYKEGWTIFVSSLAINLYTATNVVVLGMFVDNTIVGYYSAADKLINCIRRGISAVSEAIYPFVSKMIKSDMQEALMFIRKQLGAYIILGTIGCTLLFVYANEIVMFLIGPVYLETVDILRVLSFIPLVVAISTVFGAEIMLPINMYNTYSRVLISAAIFSLMIIFPLCYWFTAVGAAMTMLVTEVFITIYMGIILWQKRRYLKRRYING